jgi:toxin FitB
MFILDTNVVSELRRPDQANSMVTAWANGVALGQQYLSAMTVLELEIGVLRMERKDKRQGAELRYWLEQQVLREFAGRILPMDTEVARRSARLHVPDPLPDRDAIIAATALVHGMTVVTRNVRDFQNTKVGILNPWLNG